MKVESSSSQIINTSKPRQDFEVQKIKEQSIIEEQQEKQKSTREKKNENEKVKEQELTKDELQHIVNGLNEILKPTFTSLKFKLHEETERYYVEVIDKDTKKLLREIPAKEMLDMYAKMTEFLGLFVDRKL